MYNINNRGKWIWDIWECDIHELSELYNFSVNLYLFKKVVDKVCTHTHTHTCTL